MREILRNLPNAMQNPVHLAMMWHLAKIATAWPTLPEPIRRALIALVDAMK
jgi:hypothetical protein